MKPVNMPEDLARTFVDIWNEHIWTRDKWRTFRQLYASKEAVDLLNTSAPSFFYMCQGMFLNDVILAICRLTDPAETCGRKNLCLKQLIVDIDDSTTKEFKQDLALMLNDMNGYFKFARDNRNKRIAHSDLETYHNKHPKALSSVTRAKIEEALTAIDQFLNKILHHFEGFTISYQMLDVPDDGDTLLDCLQNAESYRNSNQEI